MQVNLIRNDYLNPQNKNINRSSSPIYKTNFSIDSVSFCGTKTFAERVKDKRTGNWWQRNISWTFGGEGKAEESVKEEMRKEITSKEKEEAVLKAKLDEQKKAQIEIDAKNKENIKSKEATIEALNKAEVAHKETIFHLGKTVEAKDELLKETKAANKRLEQLVIDQKNLVEDHKNMVQTLLGKMAEAQKQNDKRLQEELKRQMDEMQKLHKAELGEISRNINKAGQTAEIFEQMADLSNLKGFGRIAGYKEQKDILLDHFGTPIALEKDGKVANVPGGILFFGPKGNGKTTFAEAFAGHLDCELVRIGSTLDAKKDLKKLKEEMSNAQKRFKNERKRTIILINEFDVFAPKDSRIGGALKDIMDTLSKDYHCTLFATTNHPDRIDDILLRDGRFYKAGLPPADKKNAAAVLKHHAEKFAEKGINYDELAEHIVKGQPNEAFSNARIESVVQKLAQMSQGKKLTQNALLQSIRDLGPDINKIALDLFKKQIEYVKHL